MSLIAVPAVLTAVAFNTPAQVDAPISTAISQPTESASIPEAAPPAATPLPPTATAAPPPTTIPPSPTPEGQLTPTPRPAGAPLRVGIQAGHWKSKELPDELARLRTSAGAFAGGYSEAEVNLDIAQRVARLLERAGVIVDVLPATVPPMYDADAFVAIHADGASRSTARGYKAATPWRTSPASQHLLDALLAEYGAATGLPQDGAITFNMRGYYAFSYRRHTHAIAKTTPAVILETGFLTNATDRAFLTRQADTVAVGIANGIIRYLNERDPNDQAALLPPEFKLQRALDPGGIDLLAAPRDGAKVVGRAAPDRRLMPIQERDGWYQVFIAGEWRALGWVRKDAVAETDEELQIAPPPSDS